MDCIEGIEKHVIKQGDSTIRPSDNNRVLIHYKASLNHHDEPYDSSYDRNTPFSFVINSGQVIEGLNKALPTMQIGEISSFKFDPIYGYGSKGRLSLIPPNATLYFEITLIDIEILQSPIEYAYEKAIEKKDLGNVYYRSKSIQDAVKCYEEAITSLESINEENNKIKELKVILYSNLSTCYCKLRDWDSTISTCKEVFKLNKYHIKSCYHIGQAYLAKKEYELGMKYVQLGLTKSPHDNNLLDMNHKLKEGQKDYNDKQKKVYSHLFEP